MPPTAQPGLPPDPVDRLPAAMLLACTGGLIDAVVYTLHGHVFANAMTGNVILLGISAFSRDWREVANHLGPLAAFLLGVVASRFLRRLPHRQAAFCVLTLEITVLFFAGLLPNSSRNILFVATIAFVSAFQVSTFRQVGRFSYNSTFITGNLREMAESYVNIYLEPDPAERRQNRAKARKLGLICLCFLSGALIGALGASHFGDHTLWFTEPLLLTVVLLLLLRGRQGNQSPGAASPEMLRTSIAPTPAINQAGGN